MLDFTDREILFIAYLLDQGASAIARRVCEDLDNDVHTLFSPEEKRQLAVDFGEYNGEYNDPEEYMYPGYIHETGSGMSSFMADKIVKKLSSKLNIKANGAKDIYEILKSEESVKQIQQHQAEEEADKVNRDWEEKLKKFEALGKELGRL